MSAHDRKKRKQWILFFIILVAFIALLLGLYFRLSYVRESAFREEKRENLPPVAVMPAVAEEAWSSVSFLARVKGGRSVQVRAEVGGKVIRRNVVRGEKVESGDPLILLKDERKHLRLEEARAKLRSAKATLDELRRKQRQNRALFQKGIVARDTVESLSNEIESQSAQVKALEASLSLMKWDVEHLIIRAPISGTVVEVLPDVGQEILVNEVIVKMVTTSENTVVAGVDANWARRIDPGLTVSLTNSLNEEVKTAEGKIIGVSPDMESESATYAVEAKILGDGRGWLPGEVVDMRVPVELLRNVIIVPRQAVLSDHNRSFLFVYKSGKAIKLPAEVTWINENEGAIPGSTIPEGAQIIVEGHTGLTDGEAVRAVQKKDRTSNYDQSE